MFIGFTPIASFSIATPPRALKLCAFYFQLVIMSWCWRMKEPVWMEGISWGAGVWSPRQIGSTWFSPASKGVRCVVLPALCPPPHYRAQSSTHARAFSDWRFGVTEATACASCQAKGGLGSWLVWKGRNSCSCTFRKGAWKDLVGGEETLAPNYFSMILFNIQFHLLYM